MNKTQRTFYHCIKPDDASNLPPLEDEVAIRFCTEDCGNIWNNM